jgi:hypothetical protein
VKDVPLKEHLSLADQAIEKADWDRLRSMSDQDHIAAAQSDPDNPPLSEEDLKRLSSLTLRPSETQTQ